MRGAEATLPEKARMVREATPRLFCGERAQKQSSQAIPKNTKPSVVPGAGIRHVSTLDRHLPG